MVATKEKPIRDLTIKERKVLKAFFESEDGNLSAAVSKGYDTKSPAVIARQLLKRTAFSNKVSKILDDMGYSDRALASMGLKFLSATKRVYNQGAKRFEIIPDLHLQFKAWLILLKLKNLFDQPAPPPEDSFPAIGQRADPDQTERNVAVAQKFLPGRVKDDGNGDKGGD